MPHIAPAKRNRPILPAQGDNAWLFVEEDDIAKVAKVYVQYQEALRKAQPITKQSGPLPLGVSGAEQGGWVMMHARLFSIFYYDHQRLDMDCNPPIPLSFFLPGGVIEGQAFGHEMMKRLESMPTRKELMAKVAGLLKQVPMRVALAIKAVPSKLSRSVKALADAEEADRTKLVGDVFPLGAGKPAEGQQ